MGKREDDRVKYTIYELLGIGRHRQAERQAGR